MVDTIVIYISAAADLGWERHALARSVTDVPVTLGWRIVQTAIHNEPMEIEAAACADVHLLLLGSDIRAPVGLEWRVARSAGRQPIPFLKQGIPRTLAAHEFIRHIETQSDWRPFRDSSDLCQQVQKLLTAHLLEKTVTYALKSQEIERLRDWQKTLEKPPEKIEEGRSAAGSSSVILSVERYMPSEGVLIRPPENLDESETDS